MAAKKSDVDVITDTLTAGELLAAAFDATDSVRFIVKQDGTILYFNRKAYENGVLLHGKKLTKGDSLFEYAGDTTNNVKSALKSDLNRSFKGETFRVNTEIKYDKKTMWFQTEYVPVFHKLKIIAASITIYDITETKREELEKANSVIAMEKNYQECLLKTEQMLDVIYKRAKMVFGETDKTTETQIVNGLKNICADTLALKKQVASWQKK